MFMLLALLIFFSRAFSFLSEFCDCNLVSPISIVDALLLKIVLERGMTIRVVLRLSDALRFSSNA